jgi:TorA maturation chaperone TorD
MSDPTNIKIPSEQTEKLLSLSELYGMLALLYRHPSSISMDLLGAEQKRAWKEAIHGLEFPNEDQLIDFMDLLVGELDRIDLAKWAAGYEECFSHTAHGLISSYELEYGEEHSHRQPQQLGDIAAFYQAFGLKINANSHERVDHISVECGFMHFLGFKEAYALEQDGPEKAEICRKSSDRFLSEHLGQWAPSFAFRLSKYSREGLMRRLADFTLAFIVQDCEARGIAPGAKDLPIRSVIEKMDSGCVTCSLKPEFQ